MTANEALKLIDSGFTAEEIRAMSDDVPDEGQPDKKMEEGQLDKKHEEGQPEVKPQQDELLTELTNSVKDLKNTVKEMQAANIDKAKGGKSDYDKTIADTIKSFTDTL